MSNLKGKKKHVAACKDPGHGIMQLGINSAHVVFLFLPLAYMHTTEDSKALRIETVSLPESWRVR
jgi:hypothetical protein